MESNTVLTIFVAVTAIAFVGQLILLFALYKAIQKSTERMEIRAARLEESTAPLLATARAILDDAQPKFGEITSNLAEATATIRANVAVVADATGEIMERARLQVARLDELIHSTADRVEETRDYLQEKVITPVRRVHAIVQAVSAGIKFFKHSRSPKGGPQLAEEDEEMFI